MEPGTKVEIHRHPTKDESFVLLRGKVRVTTHRDDGSIIEDVVRLNCYYYRHYSFIKDIQMIVCTVLGKKMKYAGETI